MGALNQLQTLMSEAEYLAHYAQNSAEKFEYINGELWAMAGASRRHNIIAGNAFAALKMNLRGSPCFPFMSDFRVKCRHNYYYPDVVVDCANSDENQATKPILIIEVLSDSTRKMDLSFKLHDYKNMPSLQEYCVIEQDFMRVAVYRRTDDWKGTEYAIHAETEITFDSIGVTLLLAEIYENIVFEENK